MAIAHEHNLAKPQVLQDDINSVVGPEVSGELFTVLAADEPILARELLVRAAMEAGGDPEINQLLVGTGSWMYSVLAHAKNRKNTNSLEYSD